MSPTAQRRLGRRLARDISLYTENQREIVLSYQPPAVREAARRHLAVLAHLEDRKAAS